MTEVARYSFHVSSAQRTSGSNTDMNIQLSQVITRLAKNSRFQASIHGATIPFSFYQLSSDIATLSVCIVQGANTFNGTITLTPGNYSTISVLAELSSKLTALCQGSISPCTSFTPTFAFHYSTTTSLSTFSITAGTPSSTITLFFSTNLSLGLFFGFTSNADFSIGSNAVGSQPAVANPVNYLLIRSPSLRQYKNREWVVEKDVFSDVLYRIPLQTNAGTYITWYGEEDPVNLVNDNFSLLNFYLTTNLSYNPVNLQNLSWAFHLTISEILQPNYDSLFSTAFINQTFTNAPMDTTATDAETLALEREKQDNIRRLQRYKDKLGSKKNVLSNEYGKSDSHLQQPSS